MASCIEHQNIPEPLGAWQVDLEIGVVNAEGLRGTKAVRDMKKDQIAVHLPSQLSVHLGEGMVTPEVSCTLKSPHTLHMALSDLRALLKLCMCPPCPNPVLRWPS